MPHIWLRTEAKPLERRAALTPETAKKLIASGHAISVEECDNLVFDTEQYEQEGCRIVPAASWPDAPTDCYVLGLKELPEPLPALRHRHIAGSAMARLVSIPVSLAVEAVLNGEVETGVTPVPSDREHVDRWIELLRSSGENIVINELD